MRQIIKHVHLCKKAGKLKKGNRPFSRSAKRKKKKKKAEVMYFTTDVSVVCIAPEC